LTSVREILSSSELTATDQSKILNLVASGDHESFSESGRMRQCSSQARRYWEARSEPGRAGLFSWRCYVGIGLTSVREILSSSELTATDQSKILNLVASGDHE
jgi:hypothetical protein